MRHKEIHKLHRTGWLRASVLGANDGIISTASLLLGVLSAGAGMEGALVTGVAGLVAGAMSMAAGEYVSVSTQADTENADLERERKELAETPEHELAELREIYIRRGLDKALAEQVAVQLTQHDALGAHARDELGISSTMQAQPVQAALSSAAAFALGAAAPLLMALSFERLLPQTFLSAALAAASILLLAGLGFAAARTGGAPAFKSVTRVVFWGALAMGITAAVGAAFGVAA